MAGLATSRREEDVPESAKGTHTAQVAAIPPPATSQPATSQP